MSTEPIKRLALPVGGLSGASLTVYLLWRLVASVDGLQAEVKDMSGEFQKANQAFIAVATRVDEQSKRIDRQSVRIDRLRGYHENQP